MNSYKIMQLGNIEVVGPFDLPNNTPATFLEVALQAADKIGKGVAGVVLGVEYAKHSHSHFLAHLPPAIREVVFYEVEGGVPRWYRVYRGHDAPNCQIWYGIDNCPESGYISGRLAMAVITKQS